MYDVEHFAQETILVKESEVLPNSLRAAYTVLRRSKAKLLSDSKPNAVPKSITNIAMKERSTPKPTSDTPKMLCHKNRNIKQASIILCCEWTGSVGMPISGASSADHNSMLSGSSSLSQISTPLSSAAVAAPPPYIIMIMKLALYDLYVC